MVKKYKKRGGAHRLSWKKEKKWYKRKTEDSFLEQKKRGKTTLRKEKFQLTKNSWERVSGEARSLRHIKKGRADQKFDISPI